MQEGFVDKIEEAFIYCKIYIKCPMSYGEDCWSIKVNRLRRIESTQLKMLQMMLEDTEG